MGPYQASAGHPAKKESTKKGQNRIYKKRKKKIYKKGQNRIYKKQDKTKSTKRATPVLEPSWTPRSGLPSSSNPPHLHQAPYDHPYHTIRHTWSLPGPTLGTPSSPPVLTTHMDNQRRLLPNPPFRSAPQLHAPFNNPRHPPPPDSPFYVHFGALRCHLPLPIHGQTATASYMSSDAVSKGPIVKCILLPYQAPLPSSHATWLLPGLGV